MERAEDTYPELAARAHYDADQEAIAALAELNELREANERLRHNILRNHAETIHARSRR